MQQLPKAMRMSVHAECQYECKPRLLWIAKAKPAFAEGSKGRERKKPLVLV